MKLGYVIVYVPSVHAALTFFETAFGFQRRFLDDSGDYGELETGAATLAFASHQLGEANLGAAGFVRANESERPLGMEIALVTADLEGAHGRALRNGATELSAPATKPWGQSVSYLRTPEGVLIELCTPVTPRF